MTRSLPVSILLTFVTCGIYGIYWFIVLTDEVNIALGKKDTSGGMAFLFTIITCGIYSIYWAYRMGQKTGELKRMRGAGQTDDSVVYLLLSLFGLSIITWALIQNELNSNVIYRESLGSM